MSNTTTRAGSELLGAILDRITDSDAPITEAELARWRATMQADEGCRRKLGAALAHLEGLSALAAMLPAVTRAEAEGGRP